MPYPLLYRHFSTSDLPAPVCAYYAMSARRCSALPRTLQMRCLSQYLLRTLRTYLPALRRTTPTLYNVFFVSISLNICLILLLWFHVWLPGCLSLLLVRGVEGLPGASMGELHDGLRHLDAILALISVASSPSTCEVKHTRLRSLLPCHAASTQMQHRSCHLDEELSLLLMIVSPIACEVIKQTHQRLILCLPAASATWIQDYGCFSLLLFHPQVPRGLGYKGAYGLVVCQAQQSLHEGHITLCTKCFFGHLNAKLAVLSC